MLLALAIAIEGDGGGEPYPSMLDRRAGKWGWNRAKQRYLNRPMCRSGGIVRGYGGLQQHHGKIRYRKVACLADLQRNIVILDRETIKFSGSATLPKLNKFSLHAGRGLSLYP